MIAAPPLLLLTDQLLSIFRISVSVLFSTYISAVVGPPESSSSSPLSEAVTPNNHSRCGPGVWSSERRLSPLCPPFTSASILRFRMSFNELVRKRYGSFDAELRALIEAGKA